MAGSRIGQRAGWLGWRSHTSFQVSTRRSPSPSGCIHTRANVAGKQECAVSWCCPAAGAGQRKSLGEKLEKGRAASPGLAAGTDCAAIPKCQALPFTWNPNCTVLSGSTAKALQVRIDSRSVPEPPETRYFLPGGIQVPQSIACQCKTEAAVFTKLTNGLQVKHWAICETTFFLQALTSLLRLLAGECSVILSGLTYSNIMSFLIAFLGKICLQLHPVSLLRVLLILTFSQGCICHS